MRIAIPFEKDSGRIAPQFEEAASFKLYNLLNDVIVSDLTLPSFGSGSDAMVEFLKTARADVLICGGITGQSRRTLAASGFVAYPGFGGSADDAARAFARSSRPFGFEKAFRRGRPPGRGSGRRIGRPGPGSSNL